MSITITLTKKQHQQQHKINNSNNTSQYLQMKDHSVIIPKIRCIYASSIPPCLRFGTLQ